VWVEVGGWGGGWGGGARGDKGASERCCKVQGCLPVCFAQTCDSTALLVSQSTCLHVCPPPLVGVHAVTWAWPPSIGCVVVVVSSALLTVVSGAPGVCLSVLLQVLQQLVLRMIGVVCHGSRGTETRTSARPQANPGVPQTSSKQQGHFQTASAVADRRGSWNWQADLCTAWCVVSVCPFCSNSYLCLNCQRFCDIAFHLWSIHGIENI
jgi:hypothetical protein